MNDTITEITGLIAEYQAENKLEISKILHAIQKHNERIEKLEQTMKATVHWHDEDRAAHQRIDAALNGITKKVDLIFDVVRLIRHASQ